MTPRLVSASLATFTLLALLAGMPTSTSAQTHLRIAVSESLQRVDHDGPTTDPKHAPSVNALVEHLAREERVRVFYEIDGGTFATDGDWKYLFQSAGASQRVDLGDGTVRVFVGGHANMRVNGESWTDANYWAITGFANTEWRPSPTAALRSGYRFTARRFPDLAALDQQEHAGFVSGLVNLRSRTSLIGEITVGSKSYGTVADEFIVMGVPGEPGVPTAGGAATRVGRGPGMGQTTGTPGVLPSHVPGLVPAPVRVLTSVDADRVGLVQGFGRVAQSLADRLSASGEFTLRRVFGGTPPTLVATPEILFDDAVYDDPYASDGWSLRAGMKRVFVNGTTIDGGVGRIVKDYTGAVALELDGTPRSGVPLRRDRAWRTAVELSMPVASAKTGAVALDWWTGYRYTSSRSNDQYYTYTAHRVATGITLRY